MQNTCRVRPSPSPHQIRRTGLQEPSEKPEAQGGSGEPCVLRHTAGTWLTRWQGQAHSTTLDCSMALTPHTHSLGGLGWHTSLLQGALGSR